MAGKLFRERKRGEVVRTRLSSASPQNGVSDSSCIRSSESFERSRSSHDAVMVTQRTLLGRVHVLGFHHHMGNLDLTSETWDLAEDFVIARV